MGILENKKILITGGSMGIGFAVAQKCAEEGANLILISRHTDDLEKAIKFITKNDQNHMYYCLDVSRPEKVKEMAESIEKDLSFSNYSNVVMGLDCKMKISSPEIANSIS